MNLDNWANIAREIGCIDEHGQESSSSDKAHEAIEILLGKDFLKEAVRYYVSGGAGSELLRGVLWQLHPYSSMEECYRIFKTEEDVQTKRDAVELLRVVADRRALKWVPEFLAHEDQGIQNWGIGVIDQLIFSELCDGDEVSSIIQTAKQHENEHVREKAEYIFSMIAANEEQDNVLQTHYESKNA